MLKLDGQHILIAPWGMDVLAGVDDDRIHDPVGKQFINGRNFI